eukprot:976161-Amphidinium_carterae.1
MVGPWFRPAEDPDYLPQFRGSRGDLWELVVYDDEGSPQGTLVICVDQCGDASKSGTPFTGHVVAVSDEYYRWWLFESGMVKDCSFHLCAGAAPSCRWRIKKQQVIHTDRVRWVTRDSLSDGTLPWALKPICVKDIAAFFGSPTTARNAVGNPSVLDSSHLGGQGDVLPAVGTDDRGLDEDVGAGLLFPGADTAVSRQLAALKRDLGGKSTDEVDNVRRVRFADGEGCVGESVTGRADARREAPKNLVAETAEDTSRRRSASIRRRSMENVRGHGMIEARSAPDSPWTLRT